MTKLPSGDKSELSDKKAVALNYSSIDELPHVAASGQGELAEEILRLAREYGIPIHEDRDLAGMLAELKTGMSITPETFRLVAEVMTFLYYSNAKWGEEHRFVGVVQEE